MTWGPCRNLPWRPRCPDTITAEKLETILRCGAKRISVNTQTTDDDTLRRIGRTHSAQDFFDCYELARSLPFEVINVDLIAGLPGEPVESFCKSLCQVAQLRPENLTVHALSLKRAARLEYKDMERSRQGSNDIFSMLETTARVTREAGYSPYYLYRQRNTLGNLENVGYALPHTEGLYNVYIMGEYQSIVAMGAGGVSKVVGLPDGKIRARLSQQALSRIHPRQGEAAAQHRAAALPAAAGTGGPVSCRVLWPSALSCGGLPPSPRSPFPFLFLPVARFLRHRRAAGRPYCLYVRQVFLPQAGAPVRHGGIPATLRG